MIIPSIFIKWQFNKFCFKIGLDLGTFVLRAILNNNLNNIISKLTFR
jgi:hypothetical protein